MRSTIAGLALVALVAAKPVPQSSSSCEDSYSGSFKIQVVKTSSKVKRQSNGDSDLVLTLSGGKLTDSEGRTGYIAANKQFQFDNPVQAGALQTSGFSVCDGDLLAHSGITTWDQCLSGDFYNLYSDNTIAAGNPGQCEEINIQVIGSGSSSGGSSAAATTSAPVTQITDGQPQASTALSAPVTQISDGQPQATTATPVAPITQISDGQVQATTATPVAPVTQISDGQPQAPTTTAAPVAPCTQIVDGQPQCPTSTPAPVAPCTQIVDGQPQCPTTVVPYGTGAAAPTGTGVVPYPSGSIVPAIGGAASNGPVVGLLAAAGLAAAFL